MLFKQFLGDRVFGFNTFSVLNTESTLFVSLLHKLNINEYSLAINIALNNISNMFFTLD